MQDVIDFNLLKEYDTTLKDVLQVWTKQKAYSLGDKVRYKGHLLECTTAGTSGTTTLNFTGLDIGDTINDGTVVWELVEESSGKGIDFYTVGESYEVGDIVIYSGNIYQCITAHTATSTFDTTKWEEISKSGIPYYNQDTSYKVDDQVVYDNKIYKCITAHTSTSTFDSAKWEELSSDGGISIWQANTDYEVNDVVIDSNLIWQCATAHTSTSTFDESKWVCISGGEISNGLEIITLWEGNYPFTNSTEYTSPTSSTPLIELSDSVTNYDYVIIEYGLNGASDHDSVIVSSKDVIYTTTYARLNIFMVANDYSNCALWLLDSSKMFIYQHLHAGLAIGAIFRVSGIRKANQIVSSGMKYETLWEGEVGSYSGITTEIISLSEPIARYKKLGFIVQVNSVGATYYREAEVSTLMRFISQNSGLYTMANGHASNQDYVNILSTSSNSQLSVELNLSKLTKVIGISEGVVVPTGVQAAKVTLWEGSISSPTSNPVQLTDAITNYDQFEVHVTSTGVQEFSTQIFDVSDLTLGELYNYRASVHNGTLGYMYAVCIGFTDANHFNISQLDTTGWPIAYITKIVGIKYIQPDSYSTEEKLIGTWIDGKPLYRKVFENPTSSGVSTGLIDSLYSIKKAYGFGIDPNGQSYSIPFASNNFSFFNAINVTTGILTWGAYYNFNTDMTSQCSCPWIAVEYTKN